jgi:hypothetical protein
MALNMIIEPSNTKTSILTSHVSSYPPPISTKLETQFPGRHSTGGLEDGIRLDVKAS